MVNGTKSSGQRTGDPPTIEKKVSDESLGWASSRRPLNPETSSKERKNDQLLKRINNCEMEEESSLELSDNNEDSCTVCKSTLCKLFLPFGSRFTVGSYQIICCDNCYRSFHPYCISFKSDSTKLWKCPQCINLDSPLCKNSGLAFKENPKEILLACILCSSRYFELTLGC
jgi:hypothetical protein